MFAGAALMMASYGWPFIGASLALLAAGALFLGVDRIVVTLGDIRDRLPVAFTSIVPEAEEAVEGRLVRSAAEIEADLKRLRGGAS